MSLFTNDKDLTSKLEATQAEVSEHEATIQQRENEIKDMAEKMAVVTSDLEKVSAELLESTSANETLSAELTTATAQLAELEAAQEDFNGKVDSAAQAKMAELGVKEPVEQVEEGSEVDLYTQYTNLKASNPAAAGAFWRENEAAIKASV